MKPVQQRSFLLVLSHLLLIFAAFVLYAESFGHQWAMDDYVVVVGNHDIRSWAGFLEDTYSGRPLRELTYLLDYQLFALEPAGYHVQNILWHGLNASLLVLVVTSLGGPPPVAWLAGILFLVHPVNVEVVANISHRKDSLVLFFVLLALLLALRCYHQPLLKRKALWGGGAALSFGVACLAKQTAVAFFPLLLGFELSLVGRSSRFFLKNRVLVALGAFSASVICLSWYFWAWQGEGFQTAVSEVMLRMQFYGDGSNKLYLLTIIKSLAFMLKRLLWPFDMAMEYVFNVPQGWLDTWVICGLGFFIAALVFVFLFRRSLPLISMGLIWILAFWLPVSNLVWPLAYFAADRYMYAPCAGFALLVAVAVNRVCVGHKIAFYSICCLLILSLGILSWQQNRVWQDDLHLYQQAAKVSPGSTKAMMGLGIFYMNSGQLELAKQYLDRAAENFNDSKSLHLLGILHEKMGNRNEALRNYRRFVLMNEARYRSDVVQVKRLLQMRYGISP